MATRSLVRVTMALLLGGWVAESAALAQTLSLDDYGVMPRHVGTTVGSGRGAEDEFGTSVLSALAPSPTLSLFPASPLVCRGDGALFSTGYPASLFFNPNGGGVDGVSTNHAWQAETARLHLDFSVDRKTSGTAGSALQTEASLNQQMGDIYGSTQGFINPSAFVGTLGGGYAGMLASANVGGSNTLRINQGAPSAGVAGLGLSAGTVGGVPNVVPAGVMTPTIASGSHDNVDGFDYVSLVANPVGSGGVFSVNSYYCITVDEARSTGWAYSMADIFGVAPYQSNATGNRWATASSIGLNPLEDSIDGLIVFDMNLVGGMAEAGVDFALFSLAPDSLALKVLNRDAADIFFTDFTNSFAVYAMPTDLGIVPSPGGAPLMGSNIDALESRLVPEPGAIVLIGVALVLAARRERRASVH